jgi:hypothetical protein
MPDRGRRLQLNDFVRKCLTRHQGTGFTHATMSEHPATVSETTTPRTLSTSALCHAAAVTRGMLRLYESEGLIVQRT